MADLIRAGVDPDLVARVAAEIADARAGDAPQRTARQERNARYYQRHKRLNPSENHLNSSEQDAQASERLKPSEHASESVLNPHGYARDHAVAAPFEEVVVREERLSDANASSPKIEPPSESDLFPIASKPKPNGHAITPRLLEEATAIWNDFAASCRFPQIRGISKTREAKLRARLRDLIEIEGLEALEGFRKALAKIRGSPFLMGRTAHHFKCTFDFVIEERNMLKILEGNYDGEARGGNGGRHPHI